jgi:nucleotide-binding universal stress UspA family protein
MLGNAIVVGTDGSATATIAVDKAGELGQALGAAVHVVCVPGAIAADQWPQRITAQQIVADAGDRLRGQGVSVETHLPKDQGDAALALVAVADDVQAEVIVLGNRGMTGIRRLLGSLPNRVSHEARCDVLIVPTQSGSVAEFGGGSIVVGADGSSAGMRAVKEAVDLAKALDGELHVGSTSEAADSPEAAVASAVAEAADQGVSVSTHSLEGDPADALLDVAEKTNAAIVVVDGTGMHSADRERFGNVADKLSHSGSSSVLIVFAGDGGSPGEDN